jgi:hypothetical protein
MTKSKIPWDKITVKINKKFPRLAPYTKGYLRLVWKGWSTNHLIKEDLDKLIKRNKP